ncbi:MAG: 2-hydroxyacyl-CoA dehydratase [Candidatus Lokiarchaeota archaeon]|nr:2-hydroxyacyl-CoA dehydratase [Candidatus Lokiarchaeota archaeon]
MPRNMASDTIDFPSYLQMSVDFFSAPAIIEEARKSRKIGGLTFPFAELLIAGGVVPIFVPRLNKGRRYDVINAAIAARNALGMRNIARGLDFLRSVDGSGTVINVAGGIINDIISSLNETYEDAAKDAINTGTPIDHCYGARALFGLYKKLGHLIDVNLGIDLRCSVFFNYHESLEINKFVKNNYILDMPYEDSAAGLDFYEQEVWDFLRFQEKATGRRFDEAKFRNVLEDANAAKELIKGVFLDIAPGDVLPCSPATFSVLNSLLVYSQIDYNSRLQRYVEGLKALVQEMHDRVDQPSKRFDATGRPRLIYTPMFGGFEPEIAQYADEIGARVYYPDWVIYGACEPVKTTGNLVRNYAEGLMRFQHGFGFNNEEMANNIVSVARRMKADGIIFCEVFGCRSMCTGHRMLKDLIRHDGLELPVNVITFNNIGDSIGQVKTRVSAMVEMLKGR